MEYIRVLLVDDNVIIRKSFARLLSKIANVTVVGECSDGVEVLPFIKHHQVDVIFMDINMKFMNGYEATRNVKQYAPKIKIIGFSSSNTTHDVSEMIASGADGFLSKFDAEKIAIMAELNRVISL